MVGTLLTISVGSTTPPWWWTALLAPVLTGIVTATIAYLAISFERRKSANQEVIRKRIAIYDGIAPALNDILGFYLCRGGWKLLTPESIIAAKRRIDKDVHVYSFLFSPKTVKLYHNFIHSAFSTFQGAGKDACLRADLEYLKRQWKGEWKADWDERFVAQTKAISPQDLEHAYRKIMLRLAAEIGVEPKFTFWSWQ